MSIMLAVDILGCTGSAEERAALLHRTIQLAAELRGTMGNMFSFAAVMSALEMAQVLRDPRCATRGVSPVRVWRGGGGKIEELPVSLDSFVKDPGEFFHILPSDPFSGPLLPHLSDE